MRLRRGMLRRTSGIPIPLTITLKGDRFNLREYVIRMALKSEDGPLSSEEEDEVISITRALKSEFPRCWKQNIRENRSGHDQSPSGHCMGIVRAANTLISLVDRPTQHTRKDDVEDLKRWLEYGRKL